MDSPRAHAPAIGPIEVPQRKSPLREHDYLAVLLGQGVSSLGDAATFVALPLLVLLLTGSGLLMGIVGILETAPDLVFGLPAGASALSWQRACAHRRSGSVPLFGVGGGRAPRPGRLLPGLASGEHPVGQLTP